MKKKSQISMFIIIGLFIIALVGMTYFILSGYVQLQTNQNIGSDSIILSINDCIDNQLEITIFKLGIHGGNLNKPQHAYSGELFDTSYLYYGGQSFVPSIEDMENSISLYLDDVIPVECNLSSFEDFDLEIGDIKTNVKINNEKVFVDVDWNLNIKSGGDIKAVDEFSTDYNIRLISLRNFVMKIIENNNADKISIFSLIEPGYNVTIVPDDNDFVYLIKDANSEVFEEPFMFAFATNYE